MTSHDQPTPGLALPEHLREIGRLLGGEASMEERPEREE